MNKRLGIFFEQSTKGKVVVIFLIGCAALLLALGISKVALRNTLQRVDDLSVPDERLRIVNSLFRKITQLDHHQRSLILSQTTNSSKLFQEETSPILLTLDTLRGYYPNDTQQIARIDSIKTTLQKREKLLLGYLGVRNGLISNKAFSQQIGQLTGIIDSSTMGIAPIDINKEPILTDSLPLIKKEEHKGFLSRLINKRKTKKHEQKEQATKDTLPQADTLGWMRHDSLMQNVKTTIQKIEAKQHEQSTKFVSQETALAKANNLLTEKVLLILHEVEKEVVQETETHNEQAKNMVSLSIKRLGFVIVVFLMVTLLLAYLIIADITQSNTYRKELEIAKDEAEYHSMAKQRFLSNISHEIRTPLQSIIGYAELLRKQENPSKEQIDIIYHSSGHLLQIVNEVLDYNRIISNKFSFEHEVFNLKELLDEVASAISAQAQKKHLHLLVNTTATGMEYMYGDPFRLKQILYNLLGNAIKFTHQGSVTLHVTHAQQAQQYHCSFTIEDTGPGIKAEDSERIFHEFEQADDNPSSRHAGTGLGLSIVKALVDTQGGTINIKSTPGIGTVFTVNLDFAVAQIPQSHANLPMSHHYQPITVWVIDDDPFILRLCAAIFEKDRISYKCFRLPAEILAEPWTEDVGLILIDIRMPVMNGWELCKRLREKQPIGFNTIICALTAQVLPEEKEAVLQQGFDHILTKPFREMDLLSLLPNQPEKDNMVSQDQIDFALLEKMTLGDQEQIADIIQQFATDCHNDLAELQNHIDQPSPNIAQISLLLHRLGGRTAQLGLKQIAATYKEFEKATDNATSFGPTSKQAIENAITALKSLIERTIV